MNQKNIWLLLPTILLPYMILLTVATIFWSTNSIFRFVMERVFQNNGLFLLAALLCCCLLAAVCSVIFFVLSICKKWDAVSLAKGAMIIKWVQMPAYILIFVVGLLCVITVFTIPFTIGFVLLDCFTLFLTGLLNLSAAVNSVRQGVFRTKDVLWVVLLQFVFCVDVIAATVFYTKIRNYTALDQGNADIRS